MAFLNRVSNLLKQNVCKQVSSVSYAPRPFVFQAIRCMSYSASTKLFVGGLAWGTDQETLREAFSQYGTVVEARIITDRETGRSRGFGFVTFDSSEAASSAIQALDGQDLQGRNIRVNIATEKPRGGFGGGGFGGGGGYGGGGGGYGGGGYGGQGGGGYGGQGGGFGRGGNQGGDGNYGGDVSFGGGSDFGGGQFSSGGSFGESVQGGDGNYSGGKPGFASLLKDDTSGSVGGNQGPLGGEFGAGNDGFGEDDNEDGFANTRS